MSAIALLLFFWIYFPQVSHYRQLRLEEEELDRQIAQLDQKIKNLTEEKKLLENDPLYLEKVIREELGLVKPDEVVYKFIPDPNFRYLRRPDETKDGETVSIQTPSSNSDETLLEEPTR